MDPTLSFGYWVRRRRKALDLTQRALADRVGCSVVTVKKIEADERQPSRQLAERFAEILVVPPEERATFLARARGLAAGQATPPSDAGVPLPPTNFAPLPAEQTPFIGREAELEQLAQLLANPACRLLTLVGPGGSGKTRLMVRAVSAGASGRDVCFVSLAEVAPAHAAPTIATSLGLHYTGNQDIERGLLAFLRSRELLLILDNVEHLLADEQAVPGVVPELASRILETCPQIKLLVTSREQLRLQAEWLFSVTGLALASEARALFVARAQRVQPEFTAGQQAATIDEICRLLDGMPLAIELAAGWIPFLSCEQIKQRLAHDNELLATRLRDVPERHRNLRTVFDKSWSLLTDDERRLFAALSVFQGGFTGESMAALCGTSVEQLLSLVEKSLVVSEGAGRYRLHELLRRYAANQLHSSGVATTLRERHCNLFVLLAEEAASAFAGPSALDWFERLDQEQDNVRAALSWALEQPDPAVCYRLARPLTRYWYAHGRWQEGITWLRAILARTATITTPERAEALCWCGIMLARSGHEAEAIPYFREGFALAQQAGDPVALGLASLAMAAIERDGTAYLQYYERATALFRQAHDDALLAMALYFQGDDLRMHGAVTEARASYLESLQLYRRMGNQIYLAYPLGNLGRLALLEGDMAAARRSFAECVIYSRRNGNGISLADWLIRLGTVAVYEGDSSAAREAFEEAATLARDLDYQSSIPQIHAWLALIEGIAGNLQQALVHLEQSLEGYVKVVTAAEQPQHSHLDLSRSEVLEALFAAAYLHHAGGRPGPAVVMVSGIEQVAQAQGYGLDLPLQAMVEAVRTGSEAALSPTDYQLLWQQGQAMTLGELLRRAESTVPVL